MYLTIFSETLKGKSLSRTLQNLALSQIEISGNIVDLGSKSSSSSYYRFIKVESGANIVFSDLQPTKEKNKKIIKIDLEKTFPIKSSTKDFLLLNNVLDTVSIRSDIVSILNLLFYHCDCL